MRLVDENRSVRDYANNLIFIKLVASLNEETIKTQEDG